MSSIEEQIEVMTRAASSQLDRAMFIGNPKEYADSLGVEVDNGFAMHMKDRMLEIEGQLSKTGMHNTYLDKLEIVPKDPGWVDPVPDHVISPAFADNRPQVATVLVAAAVVSAAASVVSAVSTTYMATKWFAEQNGDLVLHDNIPNVRTFMDNESFLRPDIRMIDKNFGRG